MREIEPLTSTPLAGHYRAIYADPPWRFKTYAQPAPDAPGRRDAERHYPTMSKAEIMALPVREVAARDSHCYLWVTPPFYRAGLDVLDAWGFKFSTRLFTWAKVYPGRLPPWSPDDFTIGTGYHSRQNTEFVILGRRGKGVPRTGAFVRELHISERREHSRKPESIRDDIDRMIGPDWPRLEMFSRTSGRGWDAWGFDVGKFDGAA